MSEPKIFAFVPLSCNILWWHISSNEANDAKESIFGFYIPNSPNPPISDDIDGISKHRLSPITPTLKHDNTQRFPVRVLLIYDFLNYLPLYS